MRVVGSGAFRSGTDTWTISRAVFPELAARLKGAPARWVFREGTLQHPLDPADTRAQVGHVTTAWSGRWSVDCVVQLDARAGRLHQALLAMHRAGGRAMGVSLHAHAEKNWPDPQSTHFIVTAINQVHGIDFVLHPANRDARLIRPLEAHENPSPKETRP